LWGWSIWAASAAEPASPGEIGIETPAARTNADAGQTVQPPVFKQADFDMWRTLLQMVFYLVVLCALAFGLVYFYRGRLKASGSLPGKLGTHIRVIDRTTLSTRVTVHLLEVDGVRVLVTDTPQGGVMIALDVGARPAEVAS
jgi:flagellar biogenesis protein FliO